MAEYMEAEYIKKPVLKIVIKSYFKSLTEQGKYTIGVMDANADVNRIISEIPAADVVEVVYCENCKHFITDTFKRTMCNRTFTMFEMQPKDFCSYGERKE